MASRLPNEDDDEASAAAAAAAAFQTALAQQVRPLLGWDQLATMASVQRNLLQQQQQQHQQNSASINQTAAAAMAAAAASGLNPATLPTIPGLWPYGLQPSSIHSPQPNPAATLASLGLPATSYLNLQNLQTPESILSFQQQLMILEQIQQRQQLFANPHLLMAAAAASQASNNSPQSVSPLTHNQQHNLSAQGSQLNGHNSISPTLNNNHNITLNLNNTNTNNNNSLLTTVNSTLTNQHQDSLVDQHFRRSLGEDYNQIIANKTDKINVFK